MDRRTNMNPERALRTLLRHQVSLVAYTLSIVRDEHLAEDIFQDMAVTLLQGDAKLPPEDAFLPWARTVARNRALNALRDARRSARALDREVIDLLDAHWTRADDDSQAPHVDALRRCVDALGAKAKRLLAMRYREDTSCLAIAELIGKPANTVYVSLSRIQRSLAACVKRRLAVEG